VDLAKQKSVGRPLMAVYAGSPWLVAFSPDGTRLATAEGQSVTIWDATNGKKLGEPLEGGAQEVSSLAFSADGAVLAGGNNDHTLTLWDVKSQEPLVSGLKGHTGEVAGLAFSPDGATLASASSDRTAILWDVASIKLSRELKHRLGQVNIVAFSADGTRLPRLRMKWSASGIWRPASNSANRFVHLMDW
jgi:WD40 repeat protein